MAQLVEHRAVTRVVVSSTPAGPTLRVFQVFSDKDDKPEVPSPSPRSLTLWDVKDPTHYSKRVGDSVPGVVVGLAGLA